MNRKGFLGGSDVAPILGLSKWKTALEVYNDKLGLSAELQDNAPMKWGRNLEPLILKEYAEMQNCKIITGVEKKLDEFDFIQGHLDAVRADDKAVIEAKSTRNASEWGEQYSDQVPLEYICQVQLYMRLADIDFCDIPTLINGSDFRIYKVEADKTSQDKIISKLVDFWQNHVLKQIPPEAQNTNDLKQLYPLSIDAFVEADKETYDMANHLSDIKTKIKELEQAENDLAFRLQSIIGNKSSLTFSGKTIATWNATAAIKKFDLETFKTDKPELYNQYLKATEPTRRFLLKI